MGYIEDIHTENKRLIDEHKIKVGDSFQLLKPFKNEPIGKVYKINHIHYLYGWIITEFNQLPQQVSDLLKLGTIERGFKD